MNRPMLEEYQIKEINGESVDDTYDYCGYYVDLNKYCDELEEENSKLYCLKDKRFEELIKALDKACEYLAFYSLGADEDCWNFNWNEDEWKELLLKGDEDE